MPSASSTPPPLARGLRPFQRHLAQDYLDLENVRLLVTVSDVTGTRADERLKEDASRQNLILLQEVRHRVANSLQIIASLIMHTAISG